MLIEGKIGYINLNGVVIIIFNVLESKELVINIDGKNYGGFLYVIKLIEGVIKFKLKIAVDVYES